MSRIELRMDPKWVPAIERGEKTATTRLERKGWPGDVFDVAGRDYRIVRIIGMRAWDAAHTFHELEGFRTDAEMLDALRVYYPDLEDNDGVYVHVFEPCPQGAVE